jgi:flavin reductase (DIM6/NTAB) family NADH-FMN oxidoreductase RutF
MKPFPLQKAFTLIEPGPVVLITTFDGKKANVMTISWTMVMDFTPRFALLTGPWNHSCAALAKTKECVICIPTAEMAKKAVQIGSCSGRDTDKFKKFGLTALKAEQVKAPLVKECYAAIECRVVDHIKKHSIFVLDGLCAWIDPAHKNKRMIHAIGDGTFVIDGRKVNHRKIMIAKLPPGV